MIGRGLAQHSSSSLLAISCHLVERGGGREDLRGRGNIQARARQTASLTEGGRTLKQVDVFCKLS
jgi:hypothetical protein